MEYAKKLSEMAHTLSQSQKVNSLNEGNEIESQVLAHSLIDIEQSSKEILENLLPKLRSNTIFEDDIEDVLLDIGEELRHILYHTKSPKFYRYLLE